MTRGPLAPWALALLLPLAAGTPRPAPAAFREPAAAPATAAAQSPATPPPPAASQAPALPPAPVNLDFEAGDLGQMPAGWTMTAASERAGFGADLTEEQPYQGKTCAVVRGIAYSRTPGTGTMMQTFAAAAYRGQRVRFRAAVRTYDSHAQLWLAVDRPNQAPGFFDNMADRPIASNRWQVYEIVGEVAADATRIGIGITINGDGKAWIDAGAFEVLGPVHDAPPRPLAAGALTNLIAFARLLGYVRYFHPSDQAAAADWGGIATAAIAELDPESAPPPAAAANGANDAGDAVASATTPSLVAVLSSRYPTAVPQPPPAADGGKSLAATLQRLFAPLAPTLRVFPAGSKPPPLDLGPPAGVKPAELRLVGWRHTGLAVEGRPSPFLSQRVFLRTDEPGAADLDPRLPFAADLGGGAACLLPLAVWADGAGTLPHAAAAGGFQAALVKPGAAVLPGSASPAAAPASLAVSAALAAVPVTPATDRSSRLAIVILAWNAMQHFDPELAAGGVARAVAWEKALPAALHEAAESTGTDSLLAVLRRMVAATGDGQATIAAAASRRVYGLPLRWDWIEGQLVVTEVTAGAEGLRPGDAVTRIEGREVSTELAAAEAETAAATPQWRRWRAMASLALGDRGEPLRLDVESAAAAAKTAAAGTPSGTDGAGSGRRTAAPAPHAVTVVHSVAPIQIEDPADKQGPVREAAPGVLVVDVGRLGDFELAAALPRLAAAAGIVFDLRGGARSTDLLLAHLIAAPVDARQEQAPVWDRPDREGVRYVPVAAPVAPAAPRLQGRLAFISSARDVGLAENLLATVAQLHLGPIVGSPTGGARGSVASEPLPAGFSIIWTGTRPAAGALPAGAPVQPTVAVSPTRRGLAAGRDEVLEKALSLVTPPAAASAK
jgi:hypothetical protein